MSSRVPQFIIGNTVTTEMKKFAEQLGFSSSYDGLGYDLVANINDFKTGFEQMKENLGKRPMT